MAKKLATDLPYNEAAEQAVLGAALQDVNALYRVLVKVQKDDFYFAKHQIIYAAIRELFTRKSPVDVLTVTSYLMDSKELEDVGGVEYLRTCVDSIPAISSLEHYANIVIDQSVARRVVLAARDIDETYKTSELSDLNAFVLESQAKMDTAASRRRVAGFKNARELSNELDVRMGTPITVSDDNCVGLSSGYPSINRLTSGFRPGDMIIVAARPSVGKTALALNFAYNAARNSNGKVAVAIFSLEMSTDLLMDRMLGMASTVKLNKIKLHSFSAEDKVNIDGAINELKNLPIFINETSAIKLMDILANSRKLKAEHPELGLIIVDYLSLVNAEGGKKNESRQDEVRRISWSLKQLAVELKLPIIVVSQLNRNSESRTSGANAKPSRPMLSDLRESGSVEQDADVVMLLYREDYYKNQGNQTKELGEKKLNEMNNSERIEALRKTGELAGLEYAGDTSVVEVNIAKNRNGQTGTAELFFMKEFGRFREPPQSWVDQSRQIREGNFDQ